ncbi:hypothetical protein D3C72_1004220 [compost metagenome]
MFRNREGIGHHLQTARRHVVHHLECRRAAIQDDRIAIIAEINRLARNCAFFVDVDRFGYTEWPCREIAELRRMYRFGSTTHAAQLALNVQRRDIPADRRFRRIRQFGNILHRHDSFFLCGAQDDAMAFAFVHGVLLIVIIRNLFTLSIKNDQINQYRAAT